MLASSLEKYPASKEATPTSTAGRTGRSRDSTRAAGNIAKHPSRGGRSRCSRPPRPTGCHRGKPGPDPGAFSGMALTKGKVVRGACRLHLPPQHEAQLRPLLEIGRASCRERVCQYV